MLIAFVTMKFAETSFRINVHGTDIDSRGFPFLAFCANSRNNVHLHVDAVLHIMVFLSCLLWHFAQRCISTCQCPQSIMASSNSLFVKNRAPVSLRLRFLLLLAYELIRSAPVPYDFRAARNSYHRVRRVMHLCTFARRTHAQTRRRDRPHDPRPYASAPTATRTGQPGQVIAKS